MDHFNPQVLDANDYYPFGSLEPGRAYAATSAGNYRYGFNGKENDNEVKGVGDQQDYGRRIYDPRVGMFLSTDPLQAKYPWFTPYQFAGNSPIANIDLDGLENFYYIFNNTAKYGLACVKVVKQVNEQGFWQKVGSFLKNISLTPEDAVEFSGSPIKGINVKYILRQGDNSGTDREYPSYEEMTKDISQGLKAPTRDTRDAVRAEIAGAQQNIQTGISEAGNSVSTSEATSELNQDEETILSAGALAKQQADEDNVSSQTDQQATASNSGHANTTENSSAGGTTPIPLYKSNFGHTFDEHGEDVPLNYLQKRAQGSGSHVGQFLDNQGAAKFIMENLHKTKNGPVDLPIPKNLPARIVYPDGTTGPASQIRLVPGNNGVKTAYPIP